MEKPFRACVLYKGINTPARGFRMRGEGDRESSNVEDRRGLPVGGKVIGGGIGLVVLVVALIFGVDPRTLLVN